MRPKLRANVHPKTKGKKRRLQPIIKDMPKRKGLLKFEIEFLKKEKVNLVRNLHLVEALYKEAVALGIFPLKNPLDGIEVDIKIAKLVNSV